MMNGVLDRPADVLVPDWVLGKLDVTVTSLQHLIQVPLLKRV